MNEALHLIYDYVATGLRVSKGAIVKMVGIGRDQMVK